MLRQWQPQNGAPIKVCVCVRPHPSARDQPTHAHLQSVEGQRRELLPGEWISFPVLCQLSLSFGQRAPRAGRWLLQPSDGVGFWKFRDTLRHQMVCCKKKLQQSNRDVAVLVVDRCSATRRACVTSLGMKSCDIFRRGRCRRSAWEKRRDASGLAACVCSAAQPSARARFACLATCAEMVIRDFGHLSLSVVLNPEAVERGAWNLFQCRLCEMWISCHAAENCFRCLNWSEGQMKMPLLWSI